MSPLEGYLTVAQVAKRFGKSRSAVRKWVRSGLLEAKKDRVTGRIYIPAAAVEAREAHLDAWEPQEQPSGLRGATGQGQEDAADVADADSAEEADPGEDEPSEKPESSPDSEKKRDRGFLDF